MKTLKFIHCADLHLDAPFKETGTGTYADTRRKDIREAFSNILDRVKTENAQMLLICGDLYEHGTVGKSTLDWLYMVLSGAGVPVLIIPGNHDPYLKNSWYRNWDWPGNVKILSPENPSLVMDDLCVNVFGMGFSSFREDKPDLSMVPPPVKDYFNIMMIHGTLDMDFTNQAYKPVTSEELEALGYDYYAMGHFHRMRDDYALRKAFNPGSPEPLGFDEQGFHGAFAVTMTMEQGKTIIKAERFETSVRSYHEKSLDITGCKTIEEVKMRIIGLLEGLRPDRDLMRITLTGRTDLSLETDMLAGFFSEDWLCFQIYNKTQKDFNIEELEKDPSLKGAFVREIKSRIESVREAMGKDPGNAELQKEEERLLLAMNFGLEALVSGRIEWRDDI
ncbi:MAG TPA: DNA repair exonuclease [Clostridiaceae bacterium]|nr:DNA repair exonuclease [Clostridiaceae bacterium]